MVSETPELPNPASKQEADQSHEHVLTSAVSLANIHFTEYGLEPIDQAKIEVVTPDEYSLRVVSTYEDYVSSNAKEGLKKLAFRSAGIVLPGAKRILYTTDAIETYTHNPGDPEGVLLAASLAHEQYHLQSMVIRKQVGNPDEVPIYGQDYSYYAQNYKDVSYVLVGPGLEVRSQGKIVALQVRLGEFLADMQRYIVIEPHFNLNDIIGNIVDYDEIRTKHNKIFPQGIVSDHNTREFSHLCAALCVASMKKEEIVESLKLSYTDPIAFLKENPLGPVLTNQFIHGGDERDTLLDVFNKGAKELDIIDGNLQSIGYLVYENDFRNLLKK